MIHDTLDRLCCKTLSFADECGATLSGLLKIRNQSFIADSRLFPASSSKFLDESKLFI